MRKCVRAEKVPDNAIYVYDIISIKLRACARAYLLNYKNVCHAGGRGIFLRAAPYTSRRFHSFYVARARVNGDPFRIGIIAAVTDEMVS